MINESPTDKLIRELKEENARLMEALKAGGGGAVKVEAGENTQGLFTLLQVNASEEEEWCS